MDRDRAEQAISRLARAQHGAVSRHQLLEAGLTARMVDGRVKAGRLERLHPGVYAAGGCTVTWERSAMAACLWVGARSVLSHWSAGRIWGVVRPTSDVIELLVPLGEHHSRGSELVTIHRCRSLASADRATYDRLPVTTVGRTLVDLAGVVDEETLAVAVNDALCRGIAAPGRLLATLGRLAGPGRRHTAVVREALAPWLDGQGFDSVAEAQFMLAIVKSGLPKPVTRYEVRDAGVFVARLDLAWPDRKVALEVDGFRWHANPHSYASDTDRATRLNTLGWTLLRATPAQLATNPRRVLAALRRQLDDRSPSMSSPGEGRLAGERLAREEAP